MGAWGQGDAEGGVAIRQSLPGPKGGSSAGGAQCWGGRRLRVTLLCREEKEMHHIEAHHIGRVAWMDQAGCRDSRLQLFSSSSVGSLREAVRHSSPADPVSQSYSSCPSIIPLGFKSSKHVGRRLMRRLDTSFSPVAALLECLLKQQSLCHLTILRCLLLVTDRTLPTRGQFQLCQVVHCNVVHTTVTVAQMR